MTRRSRIIRALSLVGACALVACADANSNVDADGNPTVDAGGDGGADGGSDSGGDSGSDGGVTPVGGDVVINEVAAAGDPNDWFELVNVGDAEVDLSTWSFSDDIEGTPQKAFFEAGTTIAPGQYLVVEVSDEWPGFKLGGDEELGLYGPDGELVDATDWDEGGSPEGGSWGRIPDSTGEFKTLATPTPGAANVDEGGSETCGDGVVDEDEACDDGNTDADDGCSPLCRAEEGYTCDGEPSVCDTTCGDGVVAGDEQCDDGNTVDGDGCDAACLRETVATVLVVNEVSNAGDDWIELLNAGDDAIDLTGWSVSDDSPDEPEHTADLPAETLEAGAFLVLERDVDFTFGIGGDDAVQLYNPDGELADVADWNDGDADEGTTWGRLPDGTGAFQTLTLPTPGAPNMMATGGVCGDGTLDDGEACDDGNNADGDGCASDCTVEVTDPVCGNGIVEGDEQCDDNNNVDGDGCASDCTVEAPASCGDGAVGGDEACDDGGNDAGDGCAPDCTVEAGWACDAGPCAPVCGDGMYVGDESCDDTDGADGNGCSAACVLEAGATAVVINEVVAQSDDTEDWIELYNPNSFGVLLSGWSMTDDDGLPVDDPERPFVIADMELAAGAFVSFERDAPGGFLFGLARGGDTVTLFDPAGGVADETTWGDGDADAPTSWARVPDGTGDFVTLDVPTRDATNGE